MIGKTGNEISAKIREIMGNKNITIQCEDKTATVTGVTIKQNGNVVKVFSSDEEFEELDPPPAFSAFGVGAGVTTFFST